MQDKTFAFTLWKILPLSTLIEFQFLQTHGDKPHCIFEVTTNHKERKTDGQTLNKLKNRRKKGRKSSAAERLEHTSKYVK